MLEEVTDEDIKRNLDLIKSGQSPDLSLRVLGNKFKNKALNLVPRIKRTCKRCNKIFIGTLKNKYCSGECFKEAMKNSYKESRRKYYLKMKNNPEYRKHKNKITYSWKKKRMQQDETFLIKERLRC